MARPVFRLAGSGLTRRSVRLHSGAVQMSAVSVDVTRGWVDRPVSTIPDDVDVDVNDVRQLDRLAQVESGPPLQEGGGGGLRPVWNLVFLWSEGRLLRSWWC